MASRANKEARDEAPSYGAPMGPPVVTEEEKRRRERERQTKLETEPSAEERKRRIKRHEEAGKAETAKQRRDKLAEAPKPEAYTRVGETTGKPPTQIIAERPEDVGRAIDIAEGVEPEPRAAPPAETEPTIPIRKREPPKRK